MITCTQLVEQIRQSTARQWREDPYRMLNAKLLWERQKVERKDRRNRILLLSGCCSN